MDSYPRWSILLALATGCFAATGVEPPDLSGKSNPLAPGPAIEDPAAVGQGPCAGSRVGDAIAAAQTANPELPQKASLAGSGFDDGDVVFAFATSDGGFALAFVHGSGDCPAGCIDHQYWYFQTDSACVPREVGRYSTIFGSGNCWDAEGTAKWGVPKPLDPVYVCGANLAPESISGTYAVLAKGNRTACTEKMGAEPAVAIDTTLTMTVAQDAGNLASGTVTFQGTGVAFIDGVALPAKFERKRFEATLSHSNLPAKCPEETSVSAAFDFEGFVPGELSAFELRTLDCDTTAYCKGALRLGLSD